MPAVKRETKRADERDAFSPKWKNLLLWRRGERKDIKRRVNQRERHAVKQNLRKQEFD